jgi:hypothetical protein
MNFSIPSHIDQSRRLPIGPWKQHALIRKERLNESRHVVRSTSLFRDLMRILACLLACHWIVATRAGAWTLEGPEAAWHVDEKTGAIAAGATADGFEAVGACADVYTLIYVDRVEKDTEAGDAVKSANAEGLPDRLVVECHNEPLGLIITKTYRIDAETGWLFKETRIAAPKLDKSFVHMAAHAQVMPAMWRGAVLHHPAWHTGSSPLVPTDRANDAVRFTISDEGTGLMCLTHPRRNLTLGTFRYASNGRPVFWESRPMLGSGKVLDEQTGQYVSVEEDKRTGIVRGTVARPTQWHMHALHGPVGNGRTEPVRIEVGYALMAGDMFDFQLAYVNQPAMDDILHTGELTAPRWVKDIVIEDWDDHSVSEHKNYRISGESFGVALRKMWFGGRIVVVNYNFAEWTYEYPATDEQWAQTRATVRDGESLERELKFIDEYKQRQHLPVHASLEERVISRDGTHAIVRPMWKPSQLDSANRILEEAAGEERLDVAGYSHMGLHVFDRASALVGVHPELIFCARNGQPYLGGSDYYPSWENPVMVRFLDSSNPVLHNFWIQRAADRLDNIKLDVVYIDGHASAFSAVDWPRHLAPQAEDSYPMWQGMMEEAHKRGAAMFHNYPVPLFNDLGYSEYGWFAVYQDNWRLYAMRQTAQQTYNRRGRPIIVLGHFDSGDGPLIKWATTPVRFSSAFLHNIRLSMYNYGHGYPRQEADFFGHAMPWIQAIFELRDRQFVNVHARPRWWADETEIETQAYNLNPSSGLVVVMNHEDEPLEEKITFETKPLGLRKGKPTWVWRMEFPHPHTVDYSNVTHTSPIRRLAKQTRVAVHNKLPKNLSYSEAWPPNNAVMLLVTQVPALVESVDGKTSQLLLPEAYDVKISGVYDDRTGRVDLTVSNNRDTATLLVPVDDDRKGADVRMRGSDGIHAAGVLPGFEGVKSELKELDGQRFIRFSVPKGTQELMIQ